MTTVAVLVRILSISGAWCGTVLDIQLGSKREAIECTVLTECPERGVAAIARDGVVGDVPP
eukprot:CAMPEP_0183362882 /NCGR_PEP_ID=MMETSP0164_2-20130417/72103_1 /TAXON_ID=221442 /ORGANISM="Coccolithus pelagicus ssp braarudi, Strain PLY182g" /LENGTH=60 /DNA_ID=CAMNT_0025537859 /DNA_START=22 /DNA_END=200 /DNA_ORIENTATION=-